MVERLENGMYLDGLRDDFQRPKPEPDEDDWDGWEEDEEDGEDDDDDPDEEDAPFVRMQRLVDEMGTVAAELHAILDRRGVR